MELELEPETSHGTGPKGPIQETNSLWHLAQIWPEAGPETGLVMALLQHSWGQSGDQLILTPFFK